MVRPVVQFDETDVSANIGILSDIERATLTAQTTQKYAAELENLLIPMAWRKKTDGAKNLLESFYHAFHGMWIGLQQERNLRIHFALIPVVVALGVWLKVDTIGWITLVISMGLVVTAEFMNTAIEHLVDISTEGKYHESARYAKDTAASAVLCAALTACVAGCVVLGPRLAALCVR